MIDAADGQSPASRAAAAAEGLRAAGIGDVESRRDADLLARHVLGWDEATWIVRRREPPPAGAGFPEKFADVITRRVRREPVAYIRGEREFYGRPFVVTPAVLIPRPETELVVDVALPLLRRAAAPRVVDVGAGSGCLAITIAIECPHVRVVTTDVSAAALAVARENANRHRVLDRVELRHADLLAGLEGAVDLIVSNPPYVPETDRASLAPEVAGFEPAGALFAGPDGLDVIRRLLPAAAASLRPGGHLILEFGWGQAERLTQLIADTPGLALDRLELDLQRIPRVAVVTRADGDPMR